MRITALRSKILRRLKLTANNTVYVEGGLGSQLISVMLGLHRGSLDSAVQIDTSYFDHNLVLEKVDAGGLTMRPWELDRYGIRRSDLGNRSPRFRTRLSANKQAQIDSYYLSRLDFDVWKECFPIVQETYEELENLGLAPDSDFGCVHLRRGDYLNVSSRIIGLSESLDICQRLSLLVPNTLIFVSDTTFSSDERSIVEKKMNDFKCVFHCGIDQHATHGIMRLAKFLVTSNSTFSFSAALLSARSDGVSIAPQHFFGTDKLEENRIFQADADWMIVKPFKATNEERN